MLECPICRRSYDDRIQIFVPPHHQTFDTVACAQRAAEAWGWDKSAPVPVIEAVDARSETHADSASPRRALAVLGALVLAPGQRAALATGVCLLAAGTAASIYLLARTPSETAPASGVAADVAHTHRTTGRPPAATRPSVVVPAQTRPATKAIPRPAPKAIHPQRPIRAGVSYQASSFPLALRITPPDGAWVGAQWKTSSHGQPAFGWAAVGRLPVDNPRGLIAMETAFGPTPSVAAVLARLRSAGRGATYGRTTRVTLAGFPGWQIDGNVFGRFGHVFVPFSPKTAGASPPDSYKLDKGETFRIIVLDVRGKRVVLFLESFNLSAEQFQAFLTAANQILESLEFPG
jgi:hypothetical protein